MNPTTKTWEKVGGGASFEENALSYFEAGADAVGGCCTTTCTHIEQVVKARDAFRAKVVSTKDKNER